MSNTYTIIVINDCSTDDTLFEIQKLHIPCITLPVNLGIGGAVQAGLRYAYNNGYPIAIQIDGDGQHNPSDIIRLLKHVGNYDLIIGSRYLSPTGYRGSAIRRIGSAIFSLLIRAVCGRRISDPTSGFRIYTKRAIDMFSQNYPIDFPEPESLVSLLKNGYRVKEVSVQMKERTSGRSSVGVLKAIYLMFSISIGIIVSGVRVRQYTYE